MLGEAHGEATHSVSPRKFSKTIMLVQGNRNNAGQSLIGKGYVSPSEPE